MLYSPPTTDIGLDSPILGWRIYRGTTPGGQGGAPIRTIEDWNFDDELEWTDTTALDDVNYYYTIQVENMFGLSPMSNEATSFASEHGDVPDPVTNIQAVGGTGQITVSWDSPAYQGTAIILDYDLERSSATENWHTILWDFEDFVGTSEYTDEGVTPGVTYSYRVMVSNQYGEASDYSPTASAAATSATSAPSAPRSLVAQSGVGQVVLTWLAPTSQGSSAITGYKVFRGTTSGGQGTTPIGTTAAGTFTYTDTVAAGFYYYVVKAVNAVGDSPASNEADGTSVAAQPPGAPTNLAAVGHNGYVILTWDAPSTSGSSSLIRYDVFRGTSAGAIGTTPIGNTGAGALTYNDTTITNGQTYYYQVKAVNSEGSSPASNTAQATPSAPSAPSAPRNLNAIGHDGYVILTWDAPTSQGTTPISRYDVFRGTTIGGIGTTPMANVAAGTLTYNDTGVTNGNTYYYVVKAVNDQGPSPASNTAQATPSEAGVAPGAPLNLDADGMESAIVLTWQPPANVGSGVTSYQIFRATASGGQGDTPLAAVSGGVLTYVDTAVTVGTTYYYKVKAVNSFGTSGFSNEDSDVATAPPANTPTPPQNVGADGSSGKVVLTWQAPADDGGSDITGYKVYRQQGSASPSLLATVGPSVLTYEDGSATGGTEYTYYVVATNANGEGQISAQISVTPAGGDGGDGGDDDLMLFIGIGVAVFVVAALMVFLLLRKKGPAK
jgi:fibronectin type 3 domain-containing protein